MKIKIILFTVLCAVLLSACKDTVNSAYVSRTVFAMDTVMELRAYGEDAEKALEEAEKEITGLDNTLSRGRAGSEVYKINEQKKAQVSSQTADIISTALNISASTDGAFDISIAPIMDLWGFFTKDFRVPSEEEINSALQRVDYRNISVNGNTVTLNGSSQIDLGGIAKGYLSGRIMDIFKERGIQSAIVSLGGNVHALGRKPDGSKWNVAIQNPDGEGYIGKLAVEDTAVITSGGYQRYFEQDGRIYHHIINPETGYSADSGIKSATVISGNSALADGLSTALYVFGLERSTEYWRSHDGFELVLMTDDNRIYITEGLRDIWDSEYEFEVIEKTET